MSEQVKALVQAIEAVMPPADINNDWWCPNCRRAIGAATFHECCPTCGTYLGDCQPDDKWEAVRAALAALASPQVGEGDMPREGEWPKRYYRRGGWISGNQYYVEFESPTSGAYVSAGGRDPVRGYSIRDCERYVREGEWQRLSATEAAAILKGVSRA